MIYAIIVHYNNDNVDYLKKNEKILLFNDLNKAILKTQRLFNDCSIVRCMENEKLKTIISKVSGRYIYKR